MLYASSTFATNQDLEQLKSRVDISAKIDLAQEIRRYQNVICKVDNPEDFLQAIERLQADYVAITGMRYPGVRCPDGRFFGS